MRTTDSGRDGLLLINLGTPDAPTVGAVRRYLREFLSDPRVLDIDPLARTLLLNLVILPFRPRRSAAAYREIWSATRGSPLLFHSRDLANEVQSRLGQGWVVELGMRYGEPGIGPALRRLQSAGVSRVIAVPLYPQYASSSSGSALERLYDQLGALNVTPSAVTLSDFCEDPGFIGAQAEIARPVLAALSPDHVLFSYHGVPERHVRASDFSGVRCLSSEDCCASLQSANRSCYRAQCFATSRALAGALSLPEGAWSMSFQSRLGRDPWIRPFTDEVIVKLAEGGVKRLAVLCPSFVTDCLETLEEIGIRARASFIAAGGEDFALVPCVNSHPRWADALAEMARRLAG